MNGATVADVDGDDSMDIIAVSAYESEMQVSIWETGVPFNRMSWEWPTYHFDMARTGLYQSSNIGIAESKPNIILTNFRLSSNPIRAGSNLNFTLAKAGKIKLDLYDKTGRLVKNLFGGNLATGEHKLTLPAELTNGIYFIRLRVNDDVVSSKLILIR